MSRVYNFSAGPSALPLPVLERAQRELLEYGNSGMSVMEMSHRSKAYEEIISEAERLLRVVMNIPKNYKVLFLQGGATMQFSMVPQNLRRKGKADYVESGQFAQKAIDEARRFLDVNVVASSKEANFCRVPELAPEKFDKNADYFHITYNNTIFGTKFKEIPETQGVPLVSDMSSCILSEELDISKFGLIYAGAQKNIGPAGLTVVVIREDLLGQAMENTPSMLNYKIQADNGSMYNTPPTYAIYIAKLVFEWILDLGGITAIQKENESKAGIIYNFLDESTLFKGTAMPDYRSLMNVTFVTSGGSDLDNKFVKAAEAVGLVNLKGHRAVGGMRASIYNAMPAEGVLALVAFMKKFEMENKQNV